MQRVHLRGVAAENKTMQAPYDTDPCDLKGYCTMDIPRKLAILIYTAVPAIVGGGIVYHFFGSFVQVIIFEILLVLAALGLISS